jgi:hypothetical protein
MTLPKITAARPLGSPGVVRSPAAAPGSFEDRCRLDRFCRCRECKPPLGDAALRPAPLPFGSSQSSLSRRFRAAVAIAGRGR